MGVAKKLKPFIDNEKNAIGEMAKTTKEEKAARSKAVKKMNEKKVEQEKEATRIFQENFAGPLGKGLRCFIPETRKEATLTRESAQTGDRRLD